MAVRRTPAVATAWAVPIALGVAALAVRPVGTWALAGALAAGTIGVLAPGTDVRPHVGRWGAVVAVGVSAFVVVRFAWPLPPVAAGTFAVGASALAAVCEELLFRRAAYAWLERLGPAVAVAATAVLFALVHVPVHGWGVVPIDLGAGLVFGWTRWAAGTWTAPAAVHVLANLVQVA